MHNHVSAPAYPGPFRLIQVKPLNSYWNEPSGRIYVEKQIRKTFLSEYDSIEAFARQASWRQPMYILYTHGVQVSFPDSMTDRVDQTGFALLDAYGEPVPLAVLLGAVERAVFERRERERASYSFRDGKPAPCGWKRRGGSNYRSPRTRAEERAALIADEWKVPVRGRRRNLPNSWDDEPLRSDWRIRNWKRFRRTRWKEARA
jgi:hypothetical protein